MSLGVYRRKRKFDRTPEPRPRKRASRNGPLRFVVQKHAATREHYDFRLELDGSLKSWAVPRGPTLTAGDPRLAVRVEDHPLEYGDFEGVIPRGNYGAGTVMLWDSGTYLERSSADRASSEEALRAGLAKGHITFVLDGEKLKGEFALVKIKKRGADENAWLLVKKRDTEASRRDVLAGDRSVKSGRTLAQISAQATRKGEIWIPGKGVASKPPATPKPKAKPKHQPAPKRLPTPRQAPLPRRVRAMEPVFSAKAPDGEGWIFEPFGFGYRAIAEVDPSGVRLYSRAFLPFERKYPEIVKALRELGEPLVLDGELRKEKDAVRYVVTDLLYRNGQDMREMPLKKRKALLESLSLVSPLETAPWATSLAELKCSFAATTWVAKEQDACYQAGITRHWLRFRGKPAPGAKAASPDRPPLTHLDKLFWPKEGYTKGDLVHYYETVAPILIPHLVDRPQSLHRQPDGIRDEGFFHKDMTSYLPRRIVTERVPSGSSGRTINYLLCQDRWSLLYLVNLGCIELNPWLSRRGQLDRPDMVVIDLDPDGNSFDEVVEVAREVHRVLTKVNAKSYPKTSGATGLHICVPTGGRCDYETARKFAEAVCRIVHRKFPTATSLERNPAKRRGRIYLDFLQNRRGQTLAAPYCVRPYPKAPVSAPLKWVEVKRGLRPDRFTLETMPARLRRVGDLWRPLLDSSVDIEACMKKLSRLFPN